MIFYGFIGGDIVVIKDLNLSFGIQQVFDSVNINIPDGKKVGIVGVNGCGKTTLFKIILGLQEVDSGSVSFYNKPRISWLPQVITDEVPSLDITVFDYLLEGRPIAFLQKEINDLYIKVSSMSNEKEINKILSKINRLQTELDYWEPYEAEEILLQLISDMKIDDSLLEKKLNTLSGGQKSKVAFIRLLYSKPDLILLDEPTNHLDKSTKEFVINYLKNYSGGVYIISHDIEFLNRIVDKILYIDKSHHNMELFEGDYNQFKRILSEREAFLEKEAELQDKERKRLQGIIDKYIHGNEKKARIAKDRQKKLAKLEENAVVIEKKMKNASISLHQGRESTKHPLIIEDLCFKYDKSAKRYLLYKLNLDIPKGEKFLIVGENGVGKSTLLKLIVGELKPDMGKIVFGDKTDLGYYAQEHEHIDLESNLLDNLNEFDLTENEKRGYLGRFLFVGDDLYKKAKLLSPGERARLALLKLTLMKANLLILDEPTNHLDPETQKIIANNLKDFPGTIIIVSHNEEFVDYLGIERTLVLPEGRIDYYDRDVVVKYHELNEKKKK